MVDYLREHHEMDWKNEQYETQSLSENEFLSKFALIFWFVTESASGCVKGSTLDGLGVEGAGPGVGVGGGAALEPTRLREGLPRTWSNPQLSPHIRPGLEPPRLQQAAFDDCVYAVDVMRNVAVVKTTAKNVEPVRKAFPT